MALITRISRLFTADFHAVLDRIEEPEALLKQSIREMDDELAINQQRVKWLEHELEQLTMREGEVAQSLLKHSEELDVCFAAGEDNLARTLVRRRLQIQRLSQGLASKRKATQKTLDAERASLEEKRRCLESTRQKAELLSKEALTRPSSEGADWGANDPPVSDEEVEVAFLREKQNRSSL